MTSVFLLLFFFFFNKHLDSSKKDFPDRVTVTEEDALLLSVPEVRRLQWRGHFSWDSTSQVHGRSLLTLVDGE